MKSKWVVKLLALIVLALSISAAGQQRKPAQDAKPSSAIAPRKVYSGPIKSPTGDTFSISPSLESPTEFNVIISDGDERVISGEFSTEKLQAMREIMEEAKKFAFTEEAVGKAEPITSRFSSEGVRGFLVDVSKFENQSHFYITLQTQGGLITVDAGTIKRSEKKAEGFFFDILARLESQVPSPSSSSPR